MSLARRNNLIASTVFRRTVLSGLIGVMGVIGLVWIGYAIHRAQTLNEVSESLDREMEGLEGLYAEQGINGLVSALSYDGKSTWEPDWLYAILEEDEFIIRVMTGDDETLAGFDGIDPPGGKTRTFIEHEELSGHPVLSFRLPLEDRSAEVIAARFIPDRLVILQEWLVRASWLVALAAIPILLLTGFLTSRSVFRRLNTISMSAEAIDEGKMDGRIPISGTGDEFDRLSVAVNDMLDRIGTLTRNLQGVSVGVAHDLKTPVSNLAGRLELLQRDAGDPEAVSSHVLAAQGHISTLSRTLDALLRLGEVEAGQRRGAFAEVNLSELVTDLADSFEPIFEDADKHLELRVGPGVFLHGDRDLLTQLISNLLENALEHARDGAKAWIGLRAEGDHALLEVGDDGPGLPAQATESVFERFVRLESSRSTPGNGLGLSLVRAIAELHTGQARVVATEPGAVFEITLPLRGH
ncbi:MAG: HAMP domain-containing sensor histidine kinase [Pseudomonadota bacterium]